MNAARGGRRGRTLLPLLAALALAAVPAAGQAPPDRESADEAFVRLRHPPYVSAILTALHYEGRFFLPVAGVLTQLHLDATHDVARATVYGHYIERDRPYLISAGRGEASFGGRRIDLAGLLFADAEDLYAAPEAFERLFGWQLRLDPSSLDAIVLTSDTLPLARRLRRAALRPGRLDPAVTPHAPLRYGRDRQMARAGSVRYVASADASEQARHAAGHLTVAGELLGGDAQLSLDAFTAAGALSRLDVSGRWQYVLDPGAPLLTQVRAGDLLAMGLQPAAFRGVQWTNAPAEPRRVAGVYPLRGTAGPDWEVELYSDNRLIAFTTADATGEYEFSVPLTYGAALLELRAYSPTGEILVQRRRLPLPAVFLPAGTTEYTVSAGTQAGTSSPLAQLRVEHGLTRYLTAFGGYEHRSVPGEPRVDAPYIGAAARASTTFFGSAEYVGRELMRLSASALLPTNASATVQLTDYHRTSPLNVRGAAHDLTVQASVPFRVGAAGAYTRGGWQRTGLEAGGRQERRELTAGFTAHGFSPSMTYRSTEQRSPAGEYRDVELVTAAQYALWRAPTRASPNVRRALSGMLTAGRLAWDAERRQVRWWQMEAARTMRRDTRLSLLVHHDNLGAGTSVQLRFQYTGRSVHALSAVRQAGDMLAASQSVRGSVGYDPSRNAFEYSGLDWTGRAAAVFHPFVDSNGNGVPDPDEPRVEGDVLRFREAVATRRSADGTLIATDLQPYRRYSMEVVGERVPNPLWIPRDTAFSFVTDPNSFKQVFVPFVVAGVVEGRLRFEGPARHTAGVPVHIRDADGRLAARDRTYSDGSFYLLGLLPGDYVIEVPEEYQAGAGWSAEPAPFRIEARPDGDIVTDVVITARVR